MLRRHEVPARIQRTAIEDADAPVEFGGQELLCDDQLGLLQQPLDGLQQLLFGLHFEHAQRKGAIGLLEDARQADGRHDLRDVLAMHQQGSGHRQLVPGQQFMQVNLVVAPEDRLGVVDDNQAEGSGLARKFVRIVIQVGGVANEQRVIAVKAIERILADDRGAHAQFCGRAHEAMQRFGVRWGIGRGAGMQDSDSGPTLGLCAVDPAPSRHHLRRRPGQEWALVRRDFRKCQRVHRIEFAGPAGKFEPGAQQRRPQERVQTACERLIAFRRVGAEIGVDLEHITALRLRRKLLYERLHFLGKQLEDGRGAEVLDRAQVRDRLVAARFGDHRNIESLPLVRGAFAQVVDLVVGTALIGRAREIAGRQRDVRARNLVGPQAQVLDDEKGLYHFARAC